jgi:molecular chaperone DnaK
MARVKIDYGIDLGTTNSAISRMENGKAVIKQKAGQRDTMASCVAYNKKGVLVGDTAYGAYRSEKEKALSGKVKSNAFIEFKRTMGTDEIYHSSHLEKDLSSEELSAEILKTLKSFITDDNFSSIVITIPAAFKNNQIDATRRAGKLAGFDHIEVLQEPVAAATVYGLSAKNKNGFWLVFDFGGGTFDSALIKVDEGIMQVVDTAGDNHLGGKNLDFAIVDEIILPHIQENYNIDNILSNEESKKNYRDALKAFAEELKNELSFNDSYNLYKEDRCGIDDDGEEIDIDITITRSDIEKVLSPIFQKAIDVSQNLLKRNNLKGNDLDTLILVGGPTLSPIVRNMLGKQICKPDISTNPMTVVATGAALYASTVDVSEEVREQTRDTTKIQLEISNSSTTVELEEYIPIKILADKTDGEIPEKVFAEITRGDNAWSSGKVEINTTGEVVEIQLSEDKTNAFNVVLFDGKGNILESEPNSFNIIQGISGIDKMQTLPYNWGIEIKQKTSGKIVFSQVKGLERNKSVPVIGKKDGLKTQKQIRPGMESDFIKIPLYQGEHESDGTRAINNDHVYDIIISGNDLPALLPANSEVDLTFKIDKSQNMYVEAFFPYLDHTSEIDIPTDNVQSIETNWLENEIRKAKGSILELKQDGNTDTKLNKVEKEIEQIDKSFRNSKNDIDTKSKALTDLRKSLKVIDELNATTEWPKLEEEIKEEFYRLEKANTDLGNEKSTEMVNQLRNQVEEVIETKDVKLGNVLLEEIHSLFFELTFIYQIIGMIRNFDTNFENYHWKDSSRARQLINSGLGKITQNPDVEDLRQIVVSLYDLLPDDERPSGDDSVLVG